MKSRVLRTTLTSLFLISCLASSALASAENARTSVFLRASGPEHPLLLSKSGDGPAEVATAQELDAFLDTHPWTDVVYLQPASLADVEPERLRAYHEAGKLIALVNGRVSELAEALGLSIPLTDLHPERWSSHVDSVAIVIGLFDTAGALDGHLAFTDFVDGFGGAERVAAGILEALEATDAAGPQSKYECVYGPLGLTTYTGPAGTSVTGWTQTGCKYDSVNGGYLYYGSAITSTSNHDEVKVTSVTYNNCGYWHQISSTVRYGTNHVEIPGLGLLAGTPSCGSKWQTDTVHSARKGSTSYLGFTTSCAGSGC